MSAPSRRLRALGVVRRRAAVERATELAALGLARQQEEAARGAMIRHLADADALRAVPTAAVGHFVAADADRQEAVDASRRAVVREQAIVGLRTQIRHLDELVARERLVIERAVAKQDLLDLLDVHVARQQEGPGR